MKKVLLMNGPNLNMLGIREPSIYGSNTLEALEAAFTEYAESKGIQVRNTPKASSRSVAELTMAHIFSCARFISVADHTMREGKWEKKAYGKGIELAGKTIGIVGFGRIGLQVGIVAKALGMEVLAYARTPKPELEEALRMRYGTLEEVVTQSDFVTIHTPHLDGVPLITREMIAKMKDGVVIINTSRGANVDEAALLEGLNSGKVFAAGLDVYAEEPTKNHPLYTHPRVSCTPHIGGATVEAQQVLSCTVRCGQRFGSGMIIDVLRGNETEKVLQNGFERLSTFGLMKEKTQWEVRRVIDALLVQGYLQKTDGERPMLQITSAARDILLSKKTFEMRVPVAPVTAKTGQQDL